MKIALCFIINYDHILNKEDIWREWIEPNKDIINVYFYYGDIKKIKSQWILKHTLPQKYIINTSYYQIIPAYTSLMAYGLSHDIGNQWFCFLTDSCCPIISPTKFRYLFYKNYNKSIISWKPAWWNIQFHKRANLARIPEMYRLGNDPWFIMKRENVIQYLEFIRTNNNLTQVICSGGLANESLFAVVLKGFDQLEPNFKNVISASTHLADWSRMYTATSPHLFKDANERDILFIEENCKKNNYTMFIRKVSREFPNEVLKHYIYDVNREKDSKLCVKEPIIFMFYRVKNLYLIKFKHFLLPILFLFLFYKFYN
uniref:Glycosyltransferase n=1 Tax=viral metagenome TaxID=1070528 RepID=A0A6C0AQH9_9ZZZZ